MRVKIDQLYLLESKQEGPLIYEDESIEDKLSINVSQIDDNKNKMDKGK